MICALRVASHCERRFLCTVIARAKHKAIPAQEDLQGLKTDMYGFFQTSLTLILFVLVVYSLKYLLTLTNKAMKQLIDRKEAVKKAFIYSFILYMSIFLAIINFQDLSNLDIKSWIMLLLFMAAAALLVSTITTLSFLRFKK